MALSPCSGANARKVESTLTFVGRHLFEQTLPFFLTETVIRQHVRRVRIEHFPHSFLWKIQSFENFLPRLEIVAER